MHHKSPLGFLDIENHPLVFWPGNPTPLLGGGRAEAYELFLRYEAWKAAYNAYDVMDAVRHIFYHTIALLTLALLTHGSTY